jgi:hypothetical protein
LLDEQRISGILDGSDGNAILDQTSLQRCAPPPSSSFVQSSLKRLAEQAAGLRLAVGEDRIVADAMAAVTQKNPIPSKV